MRFPVVLRYAGLSLLLSAAFLLLSSLVSAWARDGALVPLLYSAAVVAAFGLFPMIFIPPFRDIKEKEGLVVVVLSWFLCSLAGTLPYTMWGGEFSFTNAWFESVSGYTTTGSSILTDVEALPKGLLFWRASTQWIGGIGIIIFVLALLPEVGSRGMVLFRSESSSLSLESFRQRTRRAVQILFVVYLGLTALETVALLFCGMTLFDAVAHAFATVATGGFSTRNASIASYHSTAIEGVVMFFMVLSGVHFGLLFAVLSRTTRPAAESEVFGFYVLLLLLGSVLVCFDVYGSGLTSFSEALRASAFQVISVGTSTGFATADSSLWPAFSQLILIFFTLQCACAGSTSGGIKVNRIVLFWKAFVRSLRKLQHPSAILAVRVGGQPVQNEAVEAGSTYIVSYLGIVLLGTVLLAALGIDALSAFSGAATSIGNLGPGLGSVGSMENFSHLPAAGKWILSLLMLLGRLEIYGMLLLLWPKFYRYG